MRVFFDASVIIASVLSSSGGSSQLFRYIKKGRITGITSYTAIEEVLDKTKKLKKSEKELGEFIAKSGLIVRKSISNEEIEQYIGKVDLEDAHLIAGAHLTKCKYLVSLDKKHLLRADIQKKFLPLRIVSPKEILEVMMTKKTKGKRE